MNIFEAKRVRMDCAACEGRDSVELKIVADSTSDTGFSVPIMVCNECGHVIINDELTASELLGL